MKTKRKPARKMKRIAVASVMTKANDIDPPAGPMRFNDLVKTSGLTIVKMAAAAIHSNGGTVYHVHLTRGQVGHSMIVAVLIPTTIDPAAHSLVMSLVRPAMLASNRKRVEEVFGVNFYQALLVSV